MERSEAIELLAAALAKAQGEIKPAVKDAKNPHFGNSYADLASVWEACRVPLTTNGLSVVQLPALEALMVSVTTMLMHTSGQWISSKIVASVARADPQNIGSAITYLRRYSLSAMVGIAPGDDDDGETTRQTAAEAQQQQAPAQQQRQARRQDPPPQRGGDKRAPDGERPNLEAALRQYDAAKTAADVEAVSALLRKLPWNASETKTIKGAKLARLEAIKDARSRPAPDGAPACPECGQVGKHKDGCPNEEPPEPGSNG